MSIPRAANDVGGVPLIGVTTYQEEAAFGVWRTECAVLPAAYVRAVQRAGGRAVLIPPDPNGAEALVEALDALVLTGGGDIDPSRFGATAHPATDQVDRARDEGELELLRAALTADLPVLGICRGMQLINVARGGSLVQHVPELVGHDDHKVTPGVFHQHDVECVEGTRLASLLGPRAVIESHHHQAVDRLGEGLIASARSEDGLVEAIELPGRSFCLGVQWHPEEGEDLELLRGLVEQAGAKAWST